MKAKLEDVDLWDVWSLSHRERRSAGVGGGSNLPIDVRKWDVSADRSVRDAEEAVVGLIS